MLLPRAPRAEVWVNSQTRGTLCQLEEACLSALWPGILKWAFMVKLAGKT